MTDRERIVRQIAYVRNAYGYVGPSLAREILAALEADGYAVYRPEDSVLAEIRNGDPIPIDSPIHLYDPDGTHRLVRCGTITGTYRLVPVGGDS